MHRESQARYVADLIFQENRRILQMIKERLEDALVLCQHKRFEGAWTQVLIAAAATARKRFPKEGDAAGFKNYIRQVAVFFFEPDAKIVEGNGVTINLGKGGPQEITLDTLIYKNLRCNLVHEATLPDEILFSHLALKEEGAVTMEFGVGLGSGKEVLVPAFWCMALARAVALTPENKDECSYLLPRIDTSQKHFWKEQ